MKIIKSQDFIAAEIDMDVKINSGQDVLDIIATARYYHQCSAIIVHKSSLGEEFFDLKSGLAGEILQKLSNYHAKMAIVGDFSGYSSKSLCAFIYESNRGNQVFFKASVEEGLEALAFSA